MIPDGHVAVMVPAGHTVHVHPPVAPAQPVGMIHDPAAAQAKAAMDAVLPKEGSVAEEAAESPAKERREQKAGTEKKEAVHKKGKKR